LQIDKEKIDFILNQIEALNRALLSLSERAKPDAVSLEKRLRNIESVSEKIAHDIGNIQACIMAILDAVQASSSNRPQRKETNP